MSPLSIRKAARTYLKEIPRLMEWHATAEFPKLFQYNKRELHLHAEKFLEGLHLTPTGYAPTLQVNVMAISFMNTFASTARNG